MRNSTLSIAILSGKGGVGKSNIALNICYGLNSLNHNVLLADCDLGLANLDILLGITPEHNMQDVFLKNTDISDLIVSINKSNGKKFDLLPANSGMADFTELGLDAHIMLCDSINKVAYSYNFMVMDIGAGITTSSLQFGISAAMRILIITPEPTSLTDGYAVMKVMLAKYNMKDFYIVVNQVSSPKEAEQTFSRLYTVSKKFLDIEPILLGSIHEDTVIHSAVIKQQPFLEFAPSSKASMDLRKIIAKIDKKRTDLLPNIANLKPLETIPGVF